MANFSEKTSKATVSIWIFLDAELHSHYKNIKAYSIGFNVLLANFSEKTYKATVSIWIFLDAELNSHFKNIKAYSVALESMELWGK